MRIAALFALLFTACASKPPLSTPMWDTVPTAVTDRLCARLRMDAVATGSVTVIRVTQPLVTPESLALLKASVATPKMRPMTRPPLFNRAIPIELGSSCKWNPLEATAARPGDEMVVEMSAPILNPEVAREAGMFVRVSLGDQHDAWYWLSLLPNGADWAPKSVFVLSK